MANTCIGYKKIRRYAYNNYFGKYAKPQSSMLLLHRPKLLISQDLALPAKKCYQHYVSLSAFIIRSNQIRRLFQIIKSNKYLVYCKHTLHIVHLFMDDFLITMRTTWLPDELLIFIDTPSSMNKYLNTPQKQ